MSQSDDIWKQWLLHRRDVTDEQKALAEEHFRPVRDKVLDNAAIKAGETLLDVGTGTGLIAFGALERVGESGRVIFSDISTDCLDHCREIAERIGLAGRAEFVEASIDELTPIADETIDVVTTRSVLIYTMRKRESFSEFFRVLRPGGRVSMFEPINRFTPDAAPGTFRGYVVEAVADLAARVRKLQVAHVGSANDAMVDFDERDLFRLAGAAGFGSMKLEYEAAVVPVKSLQWDSFYRTAPNPLALSVEEAARQALDDDERERFEECLRTALEEQTVQRHHAVAFFTAIKSADGG